MIFVFLKWVSTLVAHMITPIVLSTIMLCMDLQHVSSVYSQGVAGLGPLYQAGRNGWTRQF